MLLIVGELDSSYNFSTLYHRCLLRQILSALFCAFCIIEITTCNLLSQQAFAYWNKSRIQDLYSRSELSCSTLKLLRRQSCKICLFALVAMFLQCSFQFRCGVMVIPRNLMVLASSICPPLMFRLRLFVSSKDFWIACILFWRNLFWFSAYHTTLWLCWVKLGVCFVLTDSTLTCKIMQIICKLRNFCWSFWNIRDIK